MGAGAFISSRQCSFPRLTVDLGASGRMPVVRALYRGHLVLALTSWAAAIDLRRYRTTRGLRSPH